jgi:hypothetical protein
MTKRHGSEQLPLNLPTEKECSATKLADKHNVVSFVDAGTLSIRQEAIRRVQTSGIFSNLTPHRPKR